MRTNHPKFTIVIPTRERASVLDASLRTALAQDYDNLDVIVSDNFSDDETQDIVKSHKDPRVRYINTGTRVSMSDNWEFALEHVADGWVTLLGDDDGILPCALEKVVEIAKETGAAAIRSSACFYSWPSALNEDHGRLAIPLRSGYEIRRSREWLSRVMSGSQSYTCLPMLYNCGFVDSRLIRAVRSITGRFYHSMIPDVYSAIVLSRVEDSYAYSFEPLGINGASAFSGGTSAFANAGLRSPDETPAKKFWSESNIPFHADLPLLPDGSYPISIEALVYESYLHSDCLGNPRDPRVTHESQLEVILRRADDRHRDAILEWGKLFAARHKLSYAEVLSRSRRSRFSDRLISESRRIINGLNTVVIGSPHNPISNVYDASVAANTVMAIGPSRVRNIAQRIAARFKP